MRANETSKRVEDLSIGTGVTRAIAAAALLCGIGAAFAQSAPKPEAELFVAGPGGSNRMPFESVLTGWATKNGVRIVWTEINSAAAYAKVRAESGRKAGTVDISFGNDQVVYLSRVQGLLATLDPKLVTNAKQVLQEYAFPPEVFGTPPAGVRFQLNPFGIVYNTDIFKKNGWQPPSSWLDLYNPRYASCNIPVAPTDGTMYQAVLNQLNAGDFMKFDTTLAAFRKIAKQAPAFVNTTSQAIDMLQRGVGCIAVAYQGRAYAIEAQGAPIAFLFPKEGIGFGGGTLSIPKNAPHPIAAQQALNEFLTAEAGRVVLEKTFFTPVHPQVKKPASGLASRLLVPADFKDAKLIYPPLTVFDKIDEWSRQWSEMASSRQ